MTHGISKRAIFLKLHRRDHRPVDNYTGVILAVAVALRT